VTFVLAASATSTQSGAATLFAAAARMEASVGTRGVSVAVGATA
jgi:hypothetical protein